MPKSADAQLKPTRNRHLTLIYAAAACAALLSGGPAARAQTAATVVATSDELQEIVVTGTLLRGSGPVGSNVISVDQSSLQATGGNSIIDMLRDVPQVTNFGVSDGQRSGTGGATNIVLGNSINLRGLSPYATLTLLNGHRVPTSGTSGATVDPDSYPSVMMQKVDIVADGASATYGSDAIAGVANLIMRRDVEGIELTARGGWGNNYDEHRLGVLAGHNWGTGQISIGYENNYHSNLNGLNRSFFESDQTGAGGNDYRNVSCNPATIVIGGVNYAIPAGGVTPANAASLAPNTINRCDTAKYQDILPEVEHNNIALDFDQKFSDSISIYGDATYSWRNFTSAVQQTSGPLQVPTSNAFFVQPPGTVQSPCSPAPGAPSCETVNYFFGNDIGNNAYSVGHSENYEGTLGIDFKLGGTWHLTFDATAGIDHDEEVQYHELNNGNLAAALASGSAATALNVFGGTNSPTVLDSVFANRFYAPGDTGNQAIEAKLDGVLFHMPGGDARAALGGQWRRDELIYGINSGIPGGADLMLRQNLSRHSTSGYAELLLPFFGPDNAMSGLQRLELDVAGRYEDYSDFGSTTHPKIGLNWVPMDGLTVKASYGTSFRAPLLSELVGPLQGVFVQTYSDPQSATGTSVGYTLGGGNLELKPETATTYSLGADYQPTKQLHFNLTYYNINYKNQISSYLSDLTILQQEEQLGALITRCPSTECTSLVNKYVVPGPVFGPILPNPSVFVNGLELNLGTTKTQGVDFLGSYSIPTDHSGTWTVGLAGTYTFQYDVAFTPGGPSFDELNNIGFPLRLRMRGNVGWAAGPLSALLFVNYENGYTNTEVTPHESIASYTTVDLDLLYDVGKAFPARWSKDLAVTLHVNNIFDTDPPYVNIPISPNGGGGFDPNVASAIGRLVSVQLAKKF
jgi:iron complex outermembrane recepter protein